ncbi:hypothetical protein COP2_022122 [Malus domestica]
MVERPGKQEKFSFESDSTIILSIPIELASSHPYKIASASAAAALGALIFNFLAATNKPSSFLAITPACPLPVAATQLASTFNFM